MDSDRKYRQNGYMDSDRESKSFHEDRPRPQGPRPPLDITGPRLPRLVQHVAASRCFNCATTLPADIDFTNSVRSNRLGQLEVHVNGKGVVGDAVRRPFFLYRLILGLLPF